MSHLEDIGGHIILILYSNYLQIVLFVTDFSIVLPV